MFFLLGFLLLLRLRSFIVPPNHVAVLVNPFGTMSRVLQHGINFLLPWEIRRGVSWTFVDQNFKTQILRLEFLPVVGRQIDIAPIECVTSDDQTVSIDFLIVFKIADAEKAVFQNNDTLALLMQQVTKYARIYINKIPLEKLRAEEVQIAQQIVASIANDWTATYGLCLTVCEVQNVSTDEDTIRRRRQFRDGISAQSQSYIEQAIAFGQGRQDRHVLMQTK